MVVGRIPRSGAGWGQPAYKLPVYFDIVSGPAVLDTNVVTMLGGGAVTVSAWQLGNSNYHAAATVQRSFNVARLTGLRFRDRRTARNRPDWR